MTTTSLWSSPGGIFGRVEALWRIYIEDNLEKEFPDFPIVPGEYVVRGTFCESSEARIRDYPGSYELGVTEVKYIRISP